MTQPQEGAAQGRHLEPEELRDRSTWQVAALSGFLGALVGGSLALVGTWMNLNAQLDAQQAEFAEERAAEARVKREDAYVAFCRPRCADATG